MDKELKVVYKSFKSNIRILPIEMRVEGNKLKYYRAKKKENDRKRVKDYIENDK